MKTEDIIKELRRIMIDEHRCFGCGYEHSCSTRGCAIMRNAAEKLETQQTRINQLEAELIDERYRHDRVQDFEVAEAQELAKLRQEQRWTPVGERLPEPFVSVLAYVPSESPLQLVHESYMADETLWVCILERRPWKAGVVTHWMPLPKPPEVLPDAT